MGGVPSFFWSGAALVLKSGWASPGTFFSAVYALSVAGLYAAVFLLAFELAGSLRGGFLAVGLALVSNHLGFNSLLSHSTLFRNHADQTLAAWPLLLLAVRAWARGSPAAAYVWSGLAFNLNPFLSACLALVMLAASSLDRKGAERLLIPLKGWLVFMLAALPTWSRLPGLPAPAITSAEWASALRQWFPFHYFPSTWGAGQWLYILFHGAAFALLFVAGLRRRDRPPVMRRFGEALLGLWAAYAFFAEVLPWRTALLFEAFRLDVLGILLALIGAAALLDRLLGLGPAGWAWCGLLWAGLGNPHRTFMPLPLLLPILADWALHPGRIGSTSGWTRAWLAAAAAASFLRLAGGFSWSVFYPIEQAVLFILFSILLLGSERPLAVRAALGFAVLLSFVELGHSHGLARRGEARDQDLSEKQSVCAWLRENTRKDALVLAVPYFDDLRLESRRSMVGQIIDGGAMHWEPDFAREWSGRMRALGYRFELQSEWPRLQAQQAFPIFQRAETRLPVVPPWDAQREESLLEAYRPDYVVTPFADHSPRLKLAASFGRFAIFSVEKK